MINHYLSNLYLGDTQNYKDNFSEKIVLKTGTGAFSKDRC